MKRTIAILASIAIAVTLSGSSCSKPLPTNRQDCISQGYEWEEDSDGGECEEDDESHGYKPPKVTTKKKNAPTRSSSRPVKVKK